MRTTLTIAVLTLLGGAAHVAAQDEHAGLKIGPTFASAAIDIPEASGGHKWKGAVSGGAFAVIPVAPQLAIQIEALFAPKGTEIDREIDGVESKLSLDWVEVPVMARFFSSVAPNRVLHVFVGPYLGMRAKAELEDRVTGTISSGIRQDVSDEFRFFDFGFVAGAGMDIGRRLVIDGRYSLGLRDVDKSDETGLKNRALTFLAGFRF